MYCLQSKCGRLAASLERHWAVSPRSFDARPAGEMSSNPSKRTSYSGYWQRLDNRDRDDASVAFEPRFPMSAFHPLQTFQRMSAICGVPLLRAADRVEMNAMSGVPSPESLTSQR